MLTILRATRNDVDLTGPNWLASHRNRDSGESVRLPAAISPTDFDFFIHSERF